MFALSRGLAYGLATLALVAAALPILDAIGLYEPVPAGPSEPSQEAPTAAAIRARGYGCEPELLIERAAKRSDGSTIYRIVCGTGSGPIYALTVTAAGQQILIPLE